MKLDSRSIVKEINRCAYTQIYTNQKNNSSLEIVPMEKVRFFKIFKKRRERGWKLSCPRHSIKGNNNKA